MAGCPQEILLMQNENVPNPDLTVACSTLSVVAVNIFYNAQQEQYMKRAVVALFYTTKSILAVCNYKFVKYTLY